jgi:hypothetical protein
LWKIGNHVATDCYPVAAAARQLNYAADLTDKTASFATKLLRALSLSLFPISPPLLSSRRHLFWCFSVGDLAAGSKAGPPPATAFFFQWYGAARAHPLLGVHRLVLD